MQRFDELRRELEGRLAKLTRRTGAVERDLRRFQEPDWTERATEAENDEVLERLGEEGRDEIEQIRAALGRMEQGSYGTCKECGGEIGMDRLRAVPFVASCIECAR